MRATARLLKQELSDPRNQAAWDSTCIPWGLRRQVSFNHLEGTIPATWGASNTTGFYALRYLDLRGNMLMGTLPPGLGKTLNLLPGNAFCGAIPANATICQRRAYCDPLQISYFCSCGDSLASLPDCPGRQHALAAGVSVPCVDTLRAVVPW